MFCLAAEWLKHLSSQTVGWHCLKARDTFPTRKLWDDEFNLQLPQSPPPDTHCMVAAVKADWRTDWAGGQNHFSFRKKQQVIFTNRSLMEWRWGAFKAAWTLLDVQRKWWITEASLCSVLVLLLQSKKKRKRKKKIIQTTHPGTLIQVK